MENTKETKQERNARKARQRATKKSFYLIVIVLLIIGGTFGLVWLAKSDNSGEFLSGKEVAPINEQDHVIGERENPRVVLVEYSDFQCPACAFYEPLVEEVIEEYEDDGLTFVYRHFPLSSHIHALTAAKASEAAGLQGEFWEMKELIFESQEEWSSQSASEVEQIFFAYAGSLGLDLDKFTEDFNSQAVEDKVRRDLQSGVVAGVQGTPTFYLNDVEITARTEEGFKSIIGNALLENDGSDSNTTSTNSTTTSTTTEESI